jgi:hypothetical protein
MDMCGGSYQLWREERTAEELSLRKCISGRTCIRRDCGPHHARRKQDGYLLLSSFLKCTASGKNILSALGALSGNDSRRYQVVIEERLETLTLAPRILKLLRRPNSGHP